MLSDRERETLREIQRRLSVEDPDFARSFEPSGAVVPEGSQRRAHTVWIVLALAFSVLMLVLELPVTAAVLAAGAGLIAAARRRREVPTADDSDDHR